MTDRVASEILTPSEVKEFTGVASADKQLEWLKLQRIPHIINRAGLPVLGRYCTRMLLSGINPKVIAQPASGWELPIGKIS